MQTMTRELQDIHNEGIIDRGLRIFVAALLMAGPIFQVAVIGASFNTLHAALILASIYPAMTGILGWDPFYGLMKVKSCDLVGKNECGTLPYEIVKNMGGHLKPDNEYDHSISGSQ